MGVIHFQPARRSAGPWEVQQMLPSSSATFTLGEPVQRVAADPEQIEPHTGGTTVTGIVGVAMGVVASGVPSFGTKIPVAIAREDTEFLGQIFDVSGDAVATVDAATHEGVEFGMIEDGGDWFIDEEDTTNTHLIVTKVLPEINAALFRFLASAIEGA